MISSYIELYSCLTIYYTELRWAFRIVTEMYGFYLFTAYTSLVSILFYAYLIVSSINKLHFYKL